LESVVRRVGRREREMGRRGGGEREIEMDGRGKQGRGRKRGRGGVVQEIKKFFFFGMKHKRFVL